MGEVLGEFARDILQDSPRAGTFYLGKEAGFCDQNRLALVALVHFFVECIGDCLREAMRCGLSQYRTWTIGLMYSCGTVHSAPGCIGREVMFGQVRASIRQVGHAIQLLAQTLRFINLRLSLVCYHDGDHGLPLLTGK